MVTTATTPPAKAEVQRYRRTDISGGRLHVDRGGFHISGRRIIAVRVAIRRIASRIDGATAENCHHTERKNQAFRHAGRNLSHVVWTSPVPGGSIITGFVTTVVNRLQGLVAAALVAAIGDLKIPQRLSTIWHPQEVPLHATATSIRPTNDPPNTHHTSVGASQGGAGDSGAPRAGPASGIQGVRCLSGTLANSLGGYSPREFARRPEAGPARGKFWRSQNRARPSPIHLDWPRCGARRRFQAR
ncbi:hypothetical protein EDC26_105154 [Paralcaligenes ureilyticus]|uniref:Uncharacterized protein n=1 Tax=Paralcaligenes ureilyticus TaxID=627131 RepID=A0A4R3M6B4_9BURK|nr:hypothetical protein EDC26_105154 [Paralcaligenes ureilyticus]